MNSSAAVKERVRRVPLLGPALAGVARSVRRHTFPGSKEYWERHYAQGGTSGEGSAGALACFKAEVLNDFVARQGVTSVIELGCGDGQQLALAKYPQYLGLDVSPTTLRRTMDKFGEDPAKSFLLYNPRCFADPATWIRADLAISLDVIYHLIEDDIYELHLRHLFGAARRFVVLYTSDADTLAVVEQTAPHVKHRPVARDIAAGFPQWRLSDRIANRYPYQGSGGDTSFADFFVYERISGTPSDSDGSVGRCAASAE